MPPDLRARRMAKALKRSPPGRPIGHVENLPHLENLPRLFLESSNDSAIYFGKFVAIRIIFIPEKIGRGRQRA